MFFSYPRVVVIRASFLMSVWGEQDALLPFLLQCLQDLSQDAWGKKGFDRKTCTLLSLLFWPFSLYELLCSFPIGCHHLHFPPCFGLTPVGG